MDSCPLDCLSDSLTQGIESNNLNDQCDGQRELIKAALNEYIFSLLTKSGVGLTDEYFCSRPKLLLVPLSWRRQFAP